MKKIYFSKQGERSTLHRWRLAALNSLTSACMNVLPRPTVKLAERLLCSPSRPRNALANLEWTTYSIDVYDHKVAVYQAGHFDRSIIFCHGWSGSAGDFNAYYQPFLERGYNIVTLDHVAHGQSSGKMANLFVCVKGLEKLLASLQGKTVAGVIAHSMGGSAAISVLPQYSAKIPMALIAPVLPFFESLHSVVARSGISKTWVSKLIETFEKRYDRSADDIDPKQWAHRLNNPLLTIQDSNDHYIPLKTNQQYFSPHIAASLHQTDGLGHFRIVTSPSIVQRVIEFIDGQAQQHALA